MLNKKKVNIFSPWEKFCLCPCCHICNEAPYTSFEIYSKCDTDCQFAKGSRHNTCPSFECFCYLHSVKKTSRPSPSSVTFCKFVNTIDFDAIVLYMRRLESKHAKSIDEKKKRDKVDFPCIIAWPMRCCHYFSAKSTWFLWKCWTKIRVSFNIR